MRVTGFSEFSYGFAVVREVEDILIRRRGQFLLSAPELPSLRREKHLGYDVRIDATGVVIALQFKLGEHIRQKNPSSPTWHVTGVQSPHYRVQFQPQDDQLAVMRRLEASLADSGQRAIVRYVAPAFGSTDDFNRSYLSRQVVENSYSCKPSQIPLDGHTHHLVRLDTAARQDFMLSERVRLDSPSLEQELRDVSGQHQAEDRSGSEPTMPGAAPEWLLVVEDALLSRLPQRDLEIGRLQKRAAQDFPDRPDFQRATVAIQVGLMQGIAIGFTAMDSRR